MRKVDDPNKGRFFNLSGETFHTVHLPTLNQQVIPTN